MEDLTAPQGTAVAIGFRSDGDPHSDVNVEVTEPGGVTKVVPAFRTSSQLRMVRYSSETLGDHVLRAGSRPIAVVRVVARRDAVRSAARGAPQLAAGTRTLEHPGGAPFLWVGDTWWYGLVGARISDHDFAALAADRAEQGFTLVQVCVLKAESGVLDTDPGDLRGSPWSADLQSLNPVWWDAADARIQALVDAGLIPCLFASWGYHYGQLGETRMIAMWREMIARWGAHPVVWCLAGEASYSEDEALGIVPARPATTQLRAVNAVGRALRKMDPYERLITVHPFPGISNAPWTFLEDSDEVDFWMMQTGQLGLFDLAGLVDHVVAARRQTPTKPVVIGEATYEGIFGSSWEDVQRFQFWSSMLSGAAGFTYGAHGLWAMESEDHRHTLWGPGSEGMWGDGPGWSEAARFRGGAHVAASAKWLGTLDWSTLESRDDIVDHAQSPENRFGPYGAVLRDGTRLVYLPSVALDRTPYGAERTLEVAGFDEWIISFVSPRTGNAERVFHVRESSDRISLSRCPRPSLEDWVLVARPQ